MTNDPTIFLAPKGATTEDQAKAVMCWHKKGKGDEEWEEHSRIFFKTTKDAEDWAEAAGAKLGWQDVQFGETQIGYQVSAGELEYEDQTDMFEICGWEDGGIAEIFDWDDEQS